MKKFIFTALGLLLFAGASSAQEDQAGVMSENTKYRRSSLFTVLMEHKELNFGQEISDVFMAMETPDKFDDHSLDTGFKKFGSEAMVSKKKKKKSGDPYLEQIDSYMDGNKIAREMIAKWFNRCPETGAFDMELISYRGNYDASLTDVTMAQMSARGTAVLADAGEELIGNTFVLVNDITYIDKEERNKKIGGFTRLAGAVAGAVVSGADQLANSAADMTEKFGGFSVRITSYLYRLHWDEETAANFYHYYWHDRTNPDPEKRAAFDNEDLFKMVLVGSTETSAGNVSVKGFTAKSESDQIVKVCTRALDKAIVELQREYDEFKVKVPIREIDENGGIYVEVGLKEGLNEKSQFEVLEMIEDENGRTTYKRIAMIAPVKGEIWDNRFMAAEEAAELREAGVENPDKEAAEGNVNLTATKFRKVSGSKLYPGLLVREVTIKRS